MKPYRFLAEAQSEFEEQIRYFDEQVTGLGDRFIQSLEDGVLLIRQHPMAGEPVSENVRKTVLRASRSMSTTLTRTMKSSSWRLPLIAEGRSIGAVEREISSVDGHPTSRCRPTASAPPFS